MKAIEVLKRYAQGRRDFRGENLRSQSFRGANLSGADFSETDIRGANFREANLTGVNFTGAKAGLQRRWVLVLVIASCLLSALSGFCAAWGGYIVALIFDSSSLENQIVGWVSLIILLVFYIVSIRQGIAAAFGAVAGAVAGAFATVLLSAYLSWRALKGDPRDAWIRSSAIEFAATGGTSFRGANLTNTNFTRATLKSTDFREATIARTCWRDTQKLDRIRPGKTLLAQPAVRELLRTGNGYGKSYAGANLDGANLAGANLERANLKFANLSHATLRQANLKDANLAKTLVVGADFTAAYLTGACLEAWNINSTTQLDRVYCQYVFLLENENEKGSRERRPHDPDRVFEPGDFEKLYRKMMNLVQILLRNGIDRESFNLAFQKLMEEMPEVTPDSIQALEKKGNDVLVTLEVPEETDKSRVERRFLDVYEARLEAVKQGALLEAEQRHNQDLKDIILAREQERSANPIFNLTNHHPGDTTVSDNSSGFSISGSSDIRVVQGEGNQTTQTDSRFTNQGDNNQTIQGDGNQTAREASETEALTPQKVVQLLAYLEDRIQHLEALPPATKDKSVKRLAAAKVEAEESEPDKESIGKSLKRVNEDLEEASKTAQGIKEFVEEVAPTFVKIGKWLGMAIFG